MTRIALITCFALAAPALAAAPQDFSAAAAESAKRGKTAAGEHYGVQFMRSVASSVAAAMGACESGDFAVGSTYDVVFIVSASGHIERILPGRITPYSRCLVSHLRAPDSVAKPPTGHWPVHVRVVHGNPKTPRIWTTCCWR